MLQEYPYGVYQPVTPSSDFNIRLNQPTLDISNSPFASSELLTLDLLLPPRNTPINITILDEPIHSIPYISYIHSTSFISDHFPMDIHINIYVVAIYNEDPDLATTAVHIFRGRGLRYILLRKDHPI